MRKGNCLASFLLPSFNVVTLDGLLLPEIKKNAVQTAKKICVLYGDGAIAESIVRRWFASHHTVWIPISILFISISALSLIVSAFFYK